MSVDIPKLAVVLGSVTPPQGDIIEARVHLGATKEVSSWELLLQNWNKKYSPGGTYPIIVGQDGYINIGRGANVPQIITTRTESIKYESGPNENYLRVSGRCWGEKLFRRVVTKTYSSQKGEAIVKDLMDSFAGLSHNRGGTELVENTDTTYTKLEYENTPVFDILKYIAGSADLAGVIGFDFRVAPDGKFEFFPRSSKTSPISLSEKIEVSEYRKDVLGLRNKIMVYGVAEKKNPSMGDDWTDGLLLNYDTEVWTTDLNYHLVAVVGHSPLPDETVHIKGVQLEVRLSVPGTGYYKITYQKEGGTETDIVTDQEFINTTYQKKTHSGLDIAGDQGNDMIIRYYVKIIYGTTAYSRNHRAIITLASEFWSSNGTISYEMDDKKTGYCSVKAVKSGAVAVDLLRSITAFSAKFKISYQKLKFWIKCAGVVPLVPYVEIRAPNSSNFFYVWLPSVMENEWQAIELELKTYPDGPFFQTGSPDWENVQGIYIQNMTFGTAEPAVLFIDGLHFGGCRYSSMQEHSGSQTTYGLRELVEIDEELYSDNECMLRAKAIVAQLKDPAEYLTVRSTVIDYGTTPILAADKIHVPLPNENVDADFRILSVEYYVNAKTQTLEITMELGREVPLLADYVYALRSKTDHLSRHKIARLI